MHYRNALRARKTNRTRARRNFLVMERLEDRMVLSGASPIAVNDLYEGLAGEPLAAEVSVLSNDSDADGETMSAILFSEPSHGELELSDDGSFVYTPDADYVGQDSFMYVASDGSCPSQLASVTIEVTAPGASPVSADDSYAIAEDGTLDVGATHGLLANDTDANGDPLSAVLVDGPAHGTLTLDADGSFVYTPEADYTGMDSFLYAADDGTGEGNVATVNISVDPVNDRPTAANDFVETDEDAPLTLELPGLLGNDSDIDGDALEASLVSGPQHGDLTLNADGTFSYTPEANFHGLDGFSYVVSDGAATSDVAAVTIGVNSVNDLPVAANEEYATDEDVPLVIAAPGILANDTDVDGDVLTPTIMHGPQHGEITLNADGSFTYTPDANWNGTDGFSYVVLDGAGESEVAVATINVASIADPPTARADAYSTGEDVPLSIGAPMSVLANDSDPLGSMTAEVVAGPAHGALTLAADGTFQYTPEANWNGTDTFTYRAIGPDGSAEGTATITVQPLNDAPVAADDTIAADGELASGNVLTNDSDIDGDALTAALIEGPAHGTITLAADGSFEYVAEAGFTGDDTFTYQATDGMANSNVAAVTITVAPPQETPPPVNTRPEAVNDSYAMDGGASMSIAADLGVLANDTDAEGNALTAEIFAEPLHGAVDLATDGSFSYTPDDGYSGLDSFLYRATDGELMSALAAVTIQIAPATALAPTIPEQPTCPTEPVDEAPTPAEPPTCDEEQSSEQASCELEDDVIDRIARPSRSEEWAYDLIVCHGDWLSSLS